jgi:hypothetical protein
MTFIKHGGTDGKIAGILEEDQLTDDQKKAVKKMSEQMVKQSENDPSQKKLES